MNKAINYSEKFEQTLQEIDQAIVNKVNTLSSEPFNLSKAILFAIDYVRGEVPVIKQIAEEKDVYEMLDDKLNAMFLAETNYSGFAITTCGWAAPIKDGNDDENEIAPSQHPARRRVRLMAMCQNGQMGSSIRFSDDESVTYDSGNASGSLADAMRDMYDIVRALRVLTKETERQLP